MKKWLWSIVIVIFLFGVMVLPVNAEESPIIGFLKELFGHINQTGSAITIGQGCITKETLPLASLQLSVSKHDWFHRGGQAVTKYPYGLGLYDNFNLSKGIEKIKGSPCVFLKNAEIGISYNFYFDEISYEKDNKKKTCKNEWCITVPLIKFGW